MNSILRFELPRSVEILTGHRDPQFLAIRSTRSCYIIPADGYVPLENSKESANPDYDSHNLTTLLRKEIELAKSEARETVSDVQKAMGAIATGAAIAMAGLVVLLFNAVSGLGNVVDVWLSRSADRQRSSSPPRLPDGPFGQSRYEREFDGAGAHARVRAER